MKLQSGEMKEVERMEVSLFLCVCVCVCVCVCWVSKSYFFLISKVGDRS